MNFKTATAISTLLFASVVWTIPANAQSRLGRVLFGNGQNARPNNARVGQQFSRQNGQGINFGSGRLGFLLGNGRNQQMVRQPAVLPGATRTPIQTPNRMPFQSTRNFARPGQPIGSSPASPQVVAPIPVDATSTTQPTSLKPNPAEMPTNSFESTFSSSPASVKPIPPVASAQADKVIRIRHLDSATQEFKFKLNDTDYSLEPGKTMILDTGYEWKLVFSAGGEYGDRMAELSDPDDYEFFNSEDEGWVLIQTPDEDSAESKATSKESSIPNDEPPTPSAGATNKTDVTIDE